jgi:hypothetical protein
MQRQKYYLSHIEIYKNDVYVVRRETAVSESEERPFFCMDVDGTVITNQNLKSEITEFTKSARKNLAFVASNTSVLFTRMITLTYPAIYPMDGRIIKKQLNTFLIWLKRQGVTAYLWFLEFQRRGAPHYHVLIDGNEFIDASTIANEWYGIVNSGDAKHLQAGTRIEAGRSKDGLHRYAVKYAQKLYQKHVPEGFENVGRFWGCSRNVQPEARHRIKIETESDLSALLKGWKYEGKEKNLYNILFSASPTLLQNLSNLGISPEEIGFVVDKTLGE